MFTPILVAFATQYGSTREVAETIAAILREEGHEADVQEMEEVRTLDAYRAIVLGAPFSLGRWHRDALRFLARFERELVERPVAIFALGPVGIDPVEVETGRQQLLEELTLHPWLHPIAAEMFGGTCDPGQVGPRHKAIAALPTRPLQGMPANELRDWQAIRAWERSVAQMLRPAVPA